MALIGFQGSANDFEFLCGGSLISETFVLSAGSLMKEFFFFYLLKLYDVTAHCSYDGDKKAASKVKVGDVSRGEDNPNTYTYQIKNRIKHPEYEKSKSIDHDIMLFELARNVQFNEYVAPICLPYINEMTKNAIATGWGSTGFGESITQNLMAVQLQIFKEEECQRSFVLDGVTKNGISYDSKICAGSYERRLDTCK